MNFLDSLVLPQSSEHIELLNYMLMLIYFLFVPFLGILLGGATLSLYYKKKGTAGANKTALRFAKDIIDMVTINKSVGLIIGIVPILTVVMIYAQLLHQTTAATVGYMIASFIFLTVGIILLYSYRYSLSFAGIFKNVHSKEEEEEISEEIERFRSGNEKLLSKSGRWSLVFLYIGSWFFISGMSIATDPNEWNNQNVFTALMSIRVITKYLQFLSAAFALTGASILFGFFYWEGGKIIKDEYYKNYVRSNAIGIAFPGAVLVPLFLFINTVQLPEKALSGAVFAYATIAIVLLFISYHIFYSMIKYGNANFSGTLFFLILFALITIVIKDQLAMSNATQVQSAVLDRQFQAHLAEMRGPGADAVISGEEIFQVRCASCHSFETRMVGPAYNDVLQKYEGNVNQLIGFIRNPTKIDPAYPPMPNPGLRPNEAEAVANYLMENYKR
jgi:cytochrome c